MKITRNGVATRILLPVVALAAVTVAGTMLLVDPVVRGVREDYGRLHVTAAAGHVTTILELAVSELTAAQLMGNPVVVEAKGRVVRGEVEGFWARSGLDGLILDAGGGVVASTLGREATGSVLAARRGGWFAVEGAGERMHCVAEPFPPWGWTVVTVARSRALGEVRPELRVLLPLLVLAAVALGGSVLLVLWRNLSAPLARMVADVGADREVRATGLLELDRVAGAVNQAVARLRVRSTELAAELERRLEAERALNQKEERLRLLLGSTGEGIYGVDAQGICTFCNPAAVRVLGHSSEEDLLGKPIHRLVHHTRADGTPYPEEECKIHLARRQARGTRVADELFWRKDGTSFPVEYWASPVVDQGVVTGAVVGFIDITERLALEQRLRQSQKMEAVGRLAGGMAHDFNNMLMAIVGHATLAREAAGAGSSQREDLDQVLEAADKAAAVTRQILAFSRNRAVSLSPVDVNGIVLGMGRVLDRVLGEDVEVVYRLADGELWALADRAQIEQVLLNLWTNARDAMPGGGTLTIGTQAMACEGEPAAGLGLAPGRYALVTVADTGVGMDERTRQRVFEPFFTTKEPGKGTGLGLSIVYGIAKQHHGQILVASAPGRGSTFSLYLPLSADAAARPQPVPAGEVRGGSETVLLAEDNEHVRGLARTVLEGAGYRVLAASDGREAVEIHEAHADEIALCLFDVVMPRLGGREALGAIRAGRPGRRAILMSGYAPDPAGTAPAAPGDVLLLAKPFVPRELLRRVREALDR